MERKVLKIFGAQDNIQAEMILETLGNNQIPAYKKGVGSSDIMNIYGGNSLYGEDIYVAEEDAQKAMEVLEGMGLTEER